ncbi:MAG TPA: hypothetical protein VH253_01990 [Phycisphaerae bacterium]|nr:hypothetical protein [Phycisphaerae bacterium]
MKGRERLMVDVLVAGVVLAVAVFLWASIFVPVLASILEWLVPMRVIQMGVLTYTVPWAAVLLGEAVMVNRILRVALPVGAFVVAVLGAFAMAAGICYAMSDALHWDVVWEVVGRACWENAGGLCVSCGWVAVTHYWRRRAVRGEVVGR